MFAYSTPKNIPIKAPHRVLEEALMVSTQLLRISLTKRKKQTLQR